MRRALLIVNTRSRRGKEGLAPASETLERSGISVLRETCDSSPQLSSTIRRLSSQVDLVVLGGGDGTFHAAAPALIESGLPLGILPLGTANDLACTLGIPLDARAAAEVIVSGRVCSIDLGEVNGIPFFNVASLGLSVQITRELSGDIKRRWGRLSYAICALRALWYTRRFEAQLCYHGNVHRVRTFQVAVGNGRYYGGGMAVEQDARIDDEWLNVYSLELERLWQLALIYPAFRKGQHGMWKQVRAIRCREVEIRTSKPRAISADGELATTTPAQFRVLPKAVAVIVPERASHSSSSAGSPRSREQPQR